MSLQARGTTHRSSLRLLGIWTGQQIRQLLRNREAAFFTVVFPLLFLVLFGGLFTAPVDVPGGKVHFAQYFTPSIATFAIVTSCFTSLVITVALERDQLVLKRVRSTPLPPGIYIAARITANVVLAVVTALVLFAVGVLAFGVHIYTRMLPAATVTFLLGTAAFCALGLAVSSLVPNGDSAPAIANAIALPMTFISGVFFSLTLAPRWLVEIANLLPLVHLVNAFDRTFDPYIRGSGFDAADLLPLAVWGIVGVVVAVRTFRWEPAPGRGGRARRGRSRQRVPAESPGA